jgi:hypothetical protein
MDRVNAYHGQVVAESELDQMFDDAENAERNLALDTASQAAVADSPSSDVFGGIVSGLVVGGIAGDTSVTVPVGRARDNQGRRITLASGATVALSHTGTSAEGDYTAVGSGAVITGSCPAGERIVAALFLVYDENLSDPRTDATGATIQYRILESFHFDIQIGTSFAHPPGAPPSRTALANNKVLLADLLLTNNAGTMELVAILNSDQDWDALTGNYASLDGRRQDYIALEQADFTVLNNMDTHVRAPSARKALYDLLGIMEDGLIWGSGGGVVDPVAGQYGPMYKSTNLDASKALTRDYAQVAGSQRIHHIPRSKYGLPVKPHEFYDPMLYHYGDLVPVATIVNPENLGPWGVVGLNGNTWGRIIPISSQPGGVIQVETNSATITHGIALIGQTYFSAGHVAQTSTPAFNIGAAPWAVACFRFRYTTAIAGVFIGMGFVKDGTVPVVAGASVFGLAVIDATTGIYGHLEGSGAAGVPVQFGTVLEDTWYTVRMAVVSSTTMIFQLNDGTPVEASVAAADALPNGEYCPIFYIRNKQAAPATAQLDEVYVAAGELESDMRL